MNLLRIYNTRLLGNRNELNLKFNNEKKKKKKSDRNSFLRITNRIVNE